MAVMVTGAPGGARPGSAPHANGGKSEGGGANRLQPGHPAPPSLTFAPFLLICGANCAGYDSSRAPSAIVAVPRATSIDWTKC